MNPALYTLPITVALLFLWSLFITPLSINLSNRYRIVDRPGERKIHTIITPRGAGIVIWLGFLLWGLYSVEAIPAFRPLALGGTMVFLSGYWDDMRTLRPSIRLAFHVAAAVIFLVYVEIPIRHFPTGILWIAGMSNAFNLVDGANGLCLSMCIAASAALGLAGFPEVYFPLAGLAAGVLPWNFPKARTFIGDGGTTLLGYLYSSLFILSIMPFIESYSTIHLPLSLFLIGGIPAADTLFAIMRRLASGKSPFSPDRGHIHHRLIDAGWGAIWTVAFLNVVHLFLIAGGMLVSGFFFV
ncbi:MAG: undecaprenyl/decaprenyl-phosphate alpha-N-acetylglucosaminyl 1-phosphate transferase [Synergistaceae bacterium]|nr:MraY family glycosyltransferase [Synergistota bacterium]NLM71644.1 undecaprenyl/decaprenyl-phosphate alpha-N-acetylglucosaminyl 1-phosphate transferase [Synergistaceae bacterium]